jgi:hypothetical protein
MSQTKVLVMMAGTALSFAASAMAQSNLDQAAQADLLADVAGRTSFQGGGGSGYNGAFRIADSTGNNTLNIGGTAMFRYNISLRDDSSVGDTDDFTHGFNTPTTRLRFWGNVWDKALAYKISGNFGGSGGDTGSFGLEDAYGMYTMDNGFYFKWGQFKLPVLREVNVEDEFQLAADRSVTSQVFSQGYSQGVEVGMNSDAFRIRGGFSDGLNTAGTDFNSPAESDWALNARGDWKVMGADWERFNDFTSFRSAPDNALLIGGAAEFQSSGETGGTAGNDVDTILYTLDATWEGQGWNVFAAGYGAHIDPAGGSGLDNWGATVHAGIFVADQIELFGRYDAIFFDADAGANPATLHFATGGMNYYISPDSHAAKFTAQIGYAFNDTSSLYGSGGLLEGNTRNGFLGDSEDGEISVMAQMIVCF